MSPSNPINGRRGFSLFEFVIYCAIAISISAFLTAAAMRAINEKQRLEELAAVAHGARLTEKILAEKIRSASYLRIPAEGATSTILALEYASGTTPVVFSLNNGAIEMAEGDTTPQRITDTQTTASMLEFSGAANGDTQGLVRASFTLSSGGVTRNFNITHNIYAH